ncbi:lipoate--protein ligase family protein [Streptococcus ictaluri]|uniref:lipoate--protein ligase family protein n=1 Tax=Streptococcus ictaluri TaxID=380397 RepID=UPI002E148D95
MQLKDLTTLPVQIFQEPITTKENVRSPFIWSDVFLRAINQESNRIILHVWPMTNTVILGMLDRQLPYLALAKESIEKQGYYPVVRNIGGLAVVADQGILNFSLIIPDQLSEHISIGDAYLIMVDLVKAMFSDFYQMIEYFEIKQSYCPGNYDLSINGKKFAGLAQRRIKKGILISIYLSVCGNQMSRGEMIAEFYRIGLGDGKSNVTYPEVDPTSMANVSDLLETSFTVEDLIERLQLTLRQLGFAITNWQPEEELLQSFKKEAQTSSAR